jgi:hypothetical protein
LLAQPCAPGARLVCHRCKILAVVNDEGAGVNLFRLGEERSLGWLRYEAATPDFDGTYRHKAES